MDLSDILTIQSAKHIYIYHIFERAQHWRAQMRVRLQSWKSEYI